MPWGQSFPGACSTGWAPWLHGYGLALALRFGGFTLCTRYPRYCPSAFSATLAFRSRQLPGAVKSNAEWFPVKERAAQGIFNLGASDRFGHRPAPDRYALLGFGWRITFLIVYRWHCLGDPLADHQ